jgi:hypothetical protein
MASDEDVDVMHKEEGLKLGLQPCADVALVRIKGIGAWAAVNQSSHGRRSIGIAKGRLGGVGRGSNRVLPALTIDREVDGDDQPRRARTCICGIIGC